MAWRWNGTTGIGGCAAAPSRWPSGSTRLSLDPQPLRGFQLLAQADRFYKWTGRPGALRVLLGLSRTRAQRWDDLVGGRHHRDRGQPDGASTVKTMAVLNWEQELRDDLGAFARLSWNDGRTQNWMYTEMDWAVSAGLSLDRPALGPGRGHGGRSPAMSAACRRAIGASSRPAGSASSPATAG